MEKTQIKANVVYRFQSDKDDLGRYPTIVQFVVSIYDGYGVKKDALLRAAMNEFEECLKGFRPEQGISFKNYALWRMKSRLEQVVKSDLKSKYRDPVECN